MNLLFDGLFRVETPAGRKQLSLPGLMSALGRDEIRAIPGIQRHQEDAFYIFLCYLAGAVLARSGLQDPVQDETFWTDRLLELAEDAGETAWQLVSDNFSAPAFMQPPLPETEHKKLKLKASTPDELDLLPSAKNHDLKMARASHYNNDEWIYALISLQTMSGYLGRGNQGISRMNSGFGNRPIVEICHFLELGRRWKDAIPRLLEHRARVLSGPWGYKGDGLCLLWTEPWGGKMGLKLSGLDPFYVEICRRVRLVMENSEKPRIQALTVPAASPRIEAKELCGNVGDPWLPIDLAKKDSKNKCEAPVLTVGPAGLTPELLRRLIFGDQFQLFSLQRPANGERKHAWLSVSVLIRGQGTTEGFHEKMIQLPASVRPALFGERKQERDTLSGLGKTGIEFAGKMATSVLKPAVFAYIESGPENINFDNETAKACWPRAAKSFQDLWSDAYFPWLWNSIGKGHEAALKEWASALKDHALFVLKEVMRALPVHHAQRYKARSMAESRFWAALYSDRNFPFLKEQSDD